MNIGPVLVDPPMILAPMAGVTSYSFRLLCRQAGAGLVCTEMISSQALIRAHRKTLEMIHVHPEERPVSVQLFGADPQVMAEAARIIEPQADIIDINMGCGVPKVTKTGAGVALMAQPELAEQIVRAVVSAVAVPVTAKLRAGYHADRPNAVDIAQRAEQAGAAAVILHPRLAGGHYGRPADWSLIAQAKATLRIPVIGNGDLRTPEDARRMMHETGCDGAMIGRAALGNPHLFRQAGYYLSTGELLPPATPSERIRVALRHGRALVEQRGEVMAARQMRTHLGYYLRGFREAAEVRAQSIRIPSWAEMEQLLEQLLAKWDAEQQALAA